jgi:Domain of unknown function (DUF5668)
MTGAAPDPPRNPTFEERIDAFGRDAGAAGERLGQRAEAAGKRLANDAGFTRAADTAARAWGVIVLLVGLWFLADVTLGMDMPSIPWRDLWPVGLIVIGLAVVFRGLGRQAA